MASYKDIYEPRVFAGWLFAPGVWRGNAVWTDPSNCSIITDVTMTANTITSDVTRSSNTITWDVTISANSITDDVGIGCGKQ